MVWSVEDEFGDLPEEDPGQDFELVFESPIILNREVVRTVKVEEVVVSEQVVDILSTAPEETLAILGANEIVRVPQVERKCYEYDKEKSKLILEGGGEIVGEKNVLVWARDNNTNLFRDLIFQNYEKYLEIAYLADLEESLLWYRMLRSVTPALNIVSKKFDVMNNGLSTLGKIRNMLDFARDLGAPQSIVAFGVGNYTHDMCYHPDVRLCVDTDSWSHGDESAYFERGDLINWRDYVGEHDMILSDCSIGSDMAMGMEIPEVYYQVYKDMVEAGYFVLAKISKFGLLWKENWAVASICFYREHNFEAFVLISPRAEQNVYNMRDFDLADRMRGANDGRMRRILSREFDSPGVEFRFTMREIDKALNLANVVYRTGEKNFSVMRDVFNRFSDELGKNWRKLCLDKNPIIGDYLEYLDIPVELPCILIDVEFLAADKERLFASFHQKCVMEWYDEVGWAAVEMKN